MSNQAELDEMRLKLTENWKELFEELANSRAKVIKRAGLNFHSAFILGYLYKNPETSQSDLSELLEVSMPTTSSIVDTLVRKHLVRRESSESDRRKIILHLTGEGTDLVLSIKGELSSSFRNILAELSEEEIGTLNSVFMKIRHSMGI